MLFLRLGMGEPTEADYLDTVKQGKAGDISCRVAEDEVEVSEGACETQVRFADVIVSSLELRKLAHTLIRSIRVRFRDDQLWVSISGEINDDSVHTLVLVSGDEVRDAESVRGDTIEK